MNVAIQTAFAMLATILLIGTASAQAVFTVPPSGGDDTATIQAAFDDAVAAGPGSTVQLQAGAYCVTAPIIVRGFVGQWLGEGRDETTVRTCTKPAPFPVPAFIVADPAFPGDPLLEIRSPYVFIEVDGKPSTDVRIADMTLHLEGETNPWFIPQRPGEPLTLFRPAIHVFGSRPTVFDGVVPTASVAIDRIELRASADGLVFGDPSVTNIDNGIIVQGKFPFGDIQVNVSVTDSHFERVAFSALQIGDCIDCDIVFGGGADSANTFSTHFGTLLFAILADQSLVEVSHNSGAAQQGAAFVLQLPIPASGPSDVVISHNRLDLFNGPINPSNGLILQDLSLAFFNTLGIRALVENNTLGQTDVGYGSTPEFGIDNFLANDTIIRGNKISGDFIYAGIAAGWFDNPFVVGQNLTIVGNNLTGTTAGVAPIWLGPLSSDSVVVGGPNRDQLFDEGVDNIAPGVNNMNGNPPGPELQEGLRDLENFRDPMTGP